jgi:SMODS and SLOG-associating 2TM effector domain family 4
MSDPAVDRSSAWSKPVLERLRDWECRAAAASEVHFDVAEDLSRRNVWLGIPVVVLTAIVGTSLFASVTGGGAAVGIRIAAGTISLIAGVLASIQTFLRFGARAEQHRVAAERWAAIRREIEKARALSAEQVGDAKQLLDDIKARMDEAAEKSPVMPKRRWLRALAKEERESRSRRPPGRPRAAGLVR